MFSNFVFSLFFFSFPNKNEQEAFFQRKFCSVMGSVFIVHNITIDSYSWLFTKVQLEEKKQTRLPHYSSVSHAESEVNNYANSLSLSDTK